MSAGPTEGVDPTLRPAGPPLLRELAVLAETEIRALLFGIRSILLVVVYGGTAAAFGGFFLWAARQIEEKLIDQNPALANLDRKAMFVEMLKSDQFREQIAPALEKMGGTRLLDAVSDGRMPWIVLMVLMLSTFVLPGLVLLVGYDRISEDLSTKHARFVLQRVRRSTYLVGKLIGHWAVVLLAVIVAHLALVGLGAALAKDFDVGAVMKALPAIWVGMAVFLLAYAAYSALWSALMTPPFAALALGAMALMMIWLLSLGPLHGIWMGTWDLGLWVLNPTAIAVFLAHALVLGTGAWAILRWRDV